MRNGVKYNMAAEDYLAVKACSKSALWAIHKRSPAHAVAEREQTNAMIFGTAAHCAALEPNQFEARYVRGPEDRRGNKWKDALQEAALGVEVLTAGDYDGALAVRDACQKLPLVRDLIAVGKAEVSIFGALDAAPIKCRPDLLVENNGVILDLKTTTDASASAFARSCLQYGYHVQEAWYRYVAIMADQSNAAAPFYFLAIESKPPYAAAIYTLSKEDSADGVAIALAAFKAWRQCFEANAWPSYNEQPQELQLRPRVRISNAA